MNKQDVLKVIDKNIKESAFLKSLKTAAADFNTGKGYSALSADQIENLKAQGNAADDWKHVMVTADTHISKIIGNYFSGKVCIGGHTGNAVDIAQGINMGSGVYNSVLKNVIIGDDVLIHSCNLIANYAVRTHAALMGCGEIVCTPGSSFGNGVEIPIAIETGGREVYPYAEMDVVQAGIIAGNRDDADFIQAATKKCKEYAQAAQSDVGVIESGAVVKNTPKVENVYIGEGAVIDSALKVKNVTVLSSTDEQTEIIDGSYVVNSIIQWGCEVASMAIVDESLCTEHTHVERHGKVTQSILGPNTGIAEGEVTASLCGPFVGFHHQSLLIAANWPEGKGNVGYGANVGSNHTSKAPDQEICPGEGTFFGLGVNIKYPSDFTKSPYSIIASAVDTLPQRVEMPFSLINKSAKHYDGISPAFNEIFPAWVLSDQIYMIKRNEGKYMARNKAKRAQFVFEVFRPDIIDMIIDALKRLEAADGKEIYTSKDIAGLGKNYITERSRQKAIETYRTYLMYYAVYGVYTKAYADGKVDINDTSDARFTHEMKVFKEYCPGMSVTDALTKYAEMEATIAEECEVSKAKDDKRGARVISDYPAAHKPASEDKFVQQMKEKAITAKKNVAELLKKIS